MKINKTPARLRKDNFDLNKYLRRVAEFDFRCGILTRNDYLSNQQAYQERIAELLAEQQKTEE